MNRRTEPDTHVIDATEVQVRWLNRISDLSQKYRQNVAWLKNWSEQALAAGPAMTDIDHQTFAKVQELNGALKEVLGMRAWVFPNTFEDGDERTEFARKVSGWVALARNGNPNGLLGMNYFFVENSEG